MMSDDMTLVREFAASRSDPAFAALVERHLGLVHSSALRQVGDAQLAEEITQAVFIILARKAGSLGAKTILSAWLYRTTRYAVSTHIRAAVRRTQREQEAYMQSTVNQPDADAAWTQLAPLLDDALAKLSAADRHAIVLRYFDGKSLGEVGAGRERRRGQEARDPRGGKAARLVHQTRRDTDGDGVDGGDFRELRASRAAGLGENVIRHSADQRRGGFCFNLNPRERNIESYDTDKGKKGDWHRPGRVVARWNDHARGST